MLEIFYSLLRGKTAAQQRTLLRRCYKQHIINDVQLWELLSSYGTPMIGAAAVMGMQPILPYALAFAAGAMVFVVVEEVVPESQSGGHGDWATMGVIAGFTLMMILDVAFG